MRGYDIRELVRTQGLKETALRLDASARKTVDGKPAPDALHLSQTPEHDKMGISIKELFYAFTGRDYVTDGLRMDNDLENLFESEVSGNGRLQEDLNSTAFSIVTGNLMQRHFLEGMQSVPSIGGSLVTDYPSNLKIDRITGFKRWNLADKEVREGAAYPDSSGTTDKYVTFPEPAKTGEIVRVTDETIKYDQTGQIIDECRQLGEAQMTYKEYKIILGMFDAFYAASTKGVYYPSGTLAQLYPTADTYGNYLSGATTNISLANGREAIIAARNKFTTLAVGDDSDGKSLPVLSEPNQILAGANDRDTLFTLLRSEGDPSSANLRMNPLKAPHHNYEVLTSPLVDWLRTNYASFSGSTMTATGWAMGNFRKQFAYKSVFPLETFIQRGQESEQGFNKDVVFQFKSREKGDVFVRAQPPIFVVFVKGAA